jgi:Spy/CpxP family protein refolding chaperone
MRILFAICFVTLSLNAQQPPPDRPGGRGFPPPGRRGGVPPQGGERGERPEGKWWQNPSMVQRLALTKDQQRKLENVFQQNRPKLIDLTATLDKEQAVLDPLLAGDHPQESNVLAQFDRVAEARLELERANARMLWGFRSILSSDQWKELQADDPVRGPGPPPGRR